MTGRLKCNRRGWDKLKKRLLRFDERSFDVGFFKEDKYGAENDNLQVAEVARMNNYGTSQVPPRPFMTVDFVKYASKTFPDMARKFFKTFMTNQSPAFLPLLKDMAGQYETELRDIILRYPGHNSPSWIAEKTFDDPLYHTGEMVGSVKSKVRVKRNK